MAAAARSLLFLLLLLVAMSRMKGSSGAVAGSAGAWCVCGPEMPETELQRTLDYACGHGADCSPLLPGGQCHSPPNTDADVNTVASRCSYAANSYFHRNKGATCDFAGTATLSSTDPSSGTCKYPANANNAMGVSSLSTPIRKSGAANTMGPGVWSMLLPPILGAMLTITIS